MGLENKFLITGYVRRITYLLPYIEAIGNNKAEQEILNTLREFHSKLEVFTKKKSG